MRSSKLQQEHPSLRVDTRPDGPQGVVLVAGGEVDLETAPRLRAALEEAVAEHDRVLLDVRAITFMDSTGIATLLGAAEAARRTGRTLVVDPSAAVLRVLQLTGVDAVLSLR